MAKKIHITPLGDRVLIRPLSEDELRAATASGIIIPETSTKERSGQGEVVAVGAGKLLDDGSRAPMTVSVGDKVAYSKYSYDEVKAGGEEYYIVSEANVLAIIG